MDFEIKYPKSLRPPKFEPPQPRIEFEPRIIWTGMYFACFACGKTTGFEFSGPMGNAKCCSDECKVVLLQWESEEDPNFFINFSPVGSVVERLHDSQEAAGSIPAPGTISLWEQVLRNMLEPASED